MMTLVRNMMIMILSCNHHDHHVSVGRRIWSVVMRLTPGGFTVIYTREAYRSSLFEISTWIFHALNIPKIGDIQNMKYFQFRYWQKCVNNVFFNIRFASMLIVHNMKQC